METRAKRTPMEARKTAPTATSKWGEEHSFRVWAHDPRYLEDDKPWKCVASFKYLSDALDYIAAGQDRGLDVVFQSPAETKEIKATDRRAVYKGEPVCVKCNKPIVAHETYTAADVEATQGATYQAPKCGYFAPLSPEVVGTFKGHDPVPASNG